MKKITTYIITATMLLSASLLHAGYYDRGRAYYAKKDYEKAKEMFLKAAETSDNGNAYYFLGEIEKLSGNFVEAEKNYKLAISTRKTSRSYLNNAYWNVIVLSEQRGDIDSVVRVCKDMWLTMKDSSAKRKIETYINKFMWTENSGAIEDYKAGIRLKNAGNMEDALAKFRSALVKDSGFLSPKFEIGMMAYNRGDMDTALSYLGEIAGRINFYAEVHLILGDIYFKKNYYSRAVEHFNRVTEFGLIDQSTEYDILLRRGTSYYNIGDYEKAEKDIARAQKYNSKSLKPLLLLSAIRIKQEKYDEALKTLEKIQSIKPGTPSVLYQIGSIYYRKNNRRYITYFDSLFDAVKSKRNYSSKYNRVFEILAKDHFEEKNYSRVAAIIDRLKNTSMNYDLRLLAARSYYHLSEFDRSIEYFESINLRNDDKLMLCRAYVKSGRIEKARYIIDELKNDEFYREKIKNDPLLSKISDLKKRDDTPDIEIKNDSGDTVDPVNKQETPEIQ